MSVIFRKSNMLPTEQWTVGTDGVGDFYANGSSGENARVMGTDPFGNAAVVWQSQPNGNGNDDGGWNCNSFGIDEKKLYRFSVWVKRISSSTGGTSYFGLNASANPVSLSSGSQMGNPYWDCRNIGSFTQNVWYLLVGHVYPSDHSGGSVYVHPDTAIYTTSGYNTSIGFCNIGNDLKWYPGTTYANHRAYHYYCNDNTSRIQWWEPRMDLCDGSEPKISDLLNNTRNKLDSTSITVEGASAKNKRIVATGGVITDVGEWRIHRFNSSGTFTLSSVIGTSLPIEYLVVGGGGGGGMDMGGGGGGGGVLTGKSMLTTGSFTVTVGAGGAGAPAGSTNGQPGGHQFTISATAGGNTSFYGQTAYGGGYGGSSYFGYTPNYGYGGSGANGGGASGYSDGNTGRGGTGTQGFNGGGNGGQYYSGGGGGAGAVGASGSNRADGGAGKFSGILGRPFYWGGGGGGAAYSLSQGGLGGIGGGGGGAVGDTTAGGRQAIEWGIAGTNGSPNTWANVPGGRGGINTGGGGGGGAHYNANNKGGDGGSGIVIIRYKIK
jgi:hypothetical protein